MSFDPLVANSGRLEILTALAGEGRGSPVEFVRLRQQTRLTDGNLASHAKRLRSAGLIEVFKEFRDGKPLTRFTLTVAGRTALEAHARRLMDSIGVASATTSPQLITEISDRKNLVQHSLHDDDDDWVD